jgi:hypothetical protein
MIHSTPVHHRRNRLTAALLASVLFATPAFAASDDAKTILQVLLSKGVITQKDFDTTLDALNSKLPDGVSPVQFVQDALGVQAKEVQKAVEFTKKDEKNGSVRPSGFGFVSADGQNSINLIGQVHFDVRSLETGLSKPRWMRSDLLVFLMSSMTISFFLVRYFSKTLCFSLR